MLKRWTKYAWIVLLAALFASCSKDPELCPNHNASGESVGTERAIYSGDNTSGSVDQGGNSITDDDDDDDDAESSKKKATK